MKNALTSWFVGFLFALGLGIAGMTQPQKIYSFLDLFGNWDPTLIFVMIGAISLHFIFYKFFVHRVSPLFSAQWHIPTKTEITKSLIIGSFLFGAGWGLAGYCPGPAVVSLASLQIEPVLFVSFMILGMIFFYFIDRRFKIQR